jgi:hypothetical protein
MKAWSISETLHISTIPFRTAFLAWQLENDLENEFQFQLQGYALPGAAVNPPPHNCM